MGSQYEVIEEIELLHESFANIMAEIDRVADKKKIDKHSNPMHPLSILYRESKKYLEGFLRKIIPLCKIPNKPGESISSSKIC